MGLSKLGRLNKGVRVGSCVYEGTEHKGRVWLLGGKKGVEQMSLQGPAGERLCVLCVTL